MSFWDAAGDGLFFSKNGVAKLLDGDEGTDLTLDNLLREEEFIQETQAQSPKLIKLYVIVANLNGFPSQYSFTHSVNFQFAFAKCFREHAELPCRRPG